MRLKHKRLFIERVEIVGHVKDRESTLDRLCKDGFKIKQLGPYTNAKLWPSVDPGRFEVVADKILSEEDLAAMRRRSE